MFVDGWADARTEGVAGTPVVNKVNLRVEVFAHFIKRQAGDNHATGEDFFIGNGFVRNDFSEGILINVRNDFTNLWNADAD